MEILSGNIKTPFLLKISHSEDIFTLGEHSGELKRSVHVKEAEAAVV